MATDSTNLFVVVLVAVCQCGWFALGEESTLELPLEISKTTALGESAIQVSWRPLFSPTDEIFFKLTYRTQDGLPQTQRTTDTSAILYDLQPCTTYTISVSPCTERGGCHGEVSSTVTTLSSALTPPKIKRAKFTIIPPAIHIKIDDEADTGIPSTSSQCDQAFDMYYVEYCTDNGACLRLNATRNTTWIVLEHLDVDVLYHVNVIKRVVYSTGVRMSNPALLHLSSNPKDILEPKNPKAVAVAPTAVRLTWLPPDLSRPVDYYQISYSDNQRKNSTVNEISIGGLEPWKNYQFEIRGCHLCGCGSPAFVKLQMPMSVPSAPSNVKATSKGQDRIEIAWDKPKIPAGPLVGYLIHCTCTEPKRLYYSWRTNSNQVEVSDVSSVPESCTIGVSACNYFMDNFLCGEISEGHVST